MDNHNPPRTPNWLLIAGFYAAALFTTWLARMAPNGLALLSGGLLGIPLQVNVNHGIAVLLTAAAAYRIGRTKPSLSLLGARPLPALLFPAILFTSYAAAGWDNPQGIDPHLWALVMCGPALIYNCMEEYAWRGFLPDALGGVHTALKGLISGLFWACWHLLVFADFRQYGGFWAFLAFCLVFSLILTFAARRTRSILVAASVHAFIIRMNTATIVVACLFTTLLLAWNLLPGREKATSSGA